MAQRPGFPTTVRGTCCGHNINGQNNQFCSQFSLLQWCMQLTHYINAFTYILMKQTSENWEQKRMFDKTTWNKTRNTYGFNWAILFALLAENSYAIKGNKIIVIVVSVWDSVINQCMKQEAQNSDLTKLTNSSPLLGTSSLESHA
jgi:hypothetical protein